MKKILALATASLCSLCLAKAAPGVDSLFFDTRGSFVQSAGDGHYEPSARLEHFNIHIYGKITDNLHYRVRQRINTNPVQNNLFHSTDWLCLTWDASPRWSFTAGKTAVLIGNYEFDAAPIDVYYYSRFCDYLVQGFVFSASATCRFMPGQSLSFQACNSPLSLSLSDIYAYNLAWQGRFFPHWNTIWSLNLVEDEYHRMINYIALGNQFTLGKLTLELDYVNKASFKQNGFFFTDFTFISKLGLDLGKVRCEAKFGYEKNAAKNVDPQGRSYDMLLEAGTEFVYGGAGVEYYPLGDRRLRLHLVYCRDNCYWRDNLSMGITWRFDVISRKSL